jgi:hypothetical protein
MNTLVTMPGLAEPSHRLAQPGFLGHDVEPAFGRHFMPAFGHQHRHLRLDPAGDRNHLVGGRHFEIELDLRQVAQLLDVGVLDVSPVLAQVDGDAVGTAEVCLNRRPDRIGLVGAARLADRRHMVNIDAKFDHSSRNSLKIRRLARLLPPV